MSISINPSNLTSEEREAVEAEIAIGSTGESVEAYLTRTGQAQLDALVKAHRARKQAQMAACVPALLDAGIEPEKIVQLATGYATKPGVQAQVDELLLT